MTDDNLNERFRLDQEEAKAEAQSRDQIVWAQQVQDAETTLAQRRAITQRVMAQASLLEAVSVTLWLFLVAGSLYGATMAIQAIVGWFQ